MDIEKLLHSVKAAQRESFTAGWKSGCEVALMLATGHPADGGAPYDGPSLPAEFHQWVDRALTKLETIHA